METKMGNITRQDFAEFGVTQVVVLLLDPANRALT